MADRYNLHCIVYASSWPGLIERVLRILYPFTSLQALNQLESHKRTMQDVLAPVIVLLVIGVPLCMQFIDNL